MVALLFCFVSVHLYARLSSIFRITKQPAYEKGGNKLC